MHVHFRSFKVSEALYHIAYNTQLAQYGILERKDALAITQSYSPFDIRDLLKQPLSESNLGRYL